VSEIIDLYATCKDSYLKYLQAVFKAHNISKHMCANYIFYLKLKYLYLNKRCWYIYWYNWPYTRS